MTVVRRRPSPGGGVEVHEAKMSSAALMAAAEESGVGFAASTDGGFILPGFLPAFDAAAMLVKLLELLRQGDIDTAGDATGIPSL